MSEIAKHWIDDGWTGSGTDAGFRACPACLTRPGPERAGLLRRPIVAG